MSEKAYNVLEILHRYIKGDLIKIFPLKMFIIYSLSLFPAAGQNDTTSIKEKKSKSPEKNISLFSKDDLLEVTIYLDLASFSKKPNKMNSFDASMTIHFSDKDSINKKIIIKYRGISRYEICSFPPIQINLRNALIADSGKIKRLKLVTHCEPGGMTDEYVIREYLVYKLFNAITDTSFRVRLLKVNYVDTESNKKPIRKYGFFIEPISTLAERTNSTVVKSTNIGQKNIFPDVMDRLAIFNYMVSNWDWSVPGQHNVAVIKPLNNDNSMLGIAIPYDFDLTGIVNAEYAIPPPDLGIENIRERLFSGICRSKEEWKEELIRFLNCRQKLYSVVNEFPYLNQRSKKDITVFLDQFFNQLEKQRNMDNLIDVFTKSCKKL